MHDLTPLSLLQQSSAPEQRKDRLMQALIEIGLACACNDEDELFATLHAVLAELSDRDSEPCVFERVCARAKIPMGAYYIIVEALQSTEPPLAEEGSSARFAWLTHEGKQVLRELVALRGQ